MTYEEFNAFCGSLPATTHVVQWGGSHVWKVGGKVFAIGGWGDEDARFTFKTSELSYNILKEQEGLRPAPYLASRGMKWIQHHAAPGLSDEGLQDYIRESHRLVSLGLTKKLQRELGLNQD
ncbi:MAG: MmcQ/YjbR family DNA-binding protein [Kiloniellaceae bacterium]